MDKTDNFSALDKLGLIATKSFVAIDRKIKNAVKTDSMLAIVAPPGYGKTTANRICIGKYKESAKYAVTEIIAFNDYHNIIGSIISQVITDLTGELPKSNLLARIDQFKRALQQATARGKKIILAIDEAQNLGRDTLYDLKKIHELGHSFSRENLFSIIFFGHPRFANLIRPRELNLRIDVHHVDTLSVAEAQDFFRVQNLKITTESSLKRITKRSGLTPLGLKRAANILREIAGGDRITDEVARQYVSGDLSNAVANSGLTLNQIATAIHKRIGKLYDKTTLSKVISGNYDSSTGDKLSDEIQDILNERANQSAAKRQARMAS